MRDLAAGTLSRADVCDAQPELLRVARHHGVATQESCPVCDESECVTVSFVFGERLAKRNGRMVDPSEIDEFLEIDGVRCYSVEVCTSCAWNHIVRAFVMANPDLAGEGLDGSVTERDAEAPGDGTRS